MQQNYYKQKKNEEKQTDACHIVEFYLWNSPQCTLIRYSAAK